VSKTVLDLNEVYVTLKHAKIISCCCLGKVDLLMAGGAAEVILICLRHCFIRIYPQSLNFNNTLFQVYVAFANMDFISLVPGTVQGPKH